MEPEVILVAFDASAAKDTTHCALEWAVSNVAKPADSLILLALVPPPGKPPTKQNRPSRMSHFLSCLVNRCDQGSNRDSCSTDQGLGLIQNDLKKKIRDVCLNRMHQLRSTHNVAQVHTQVKVMVHAQLGSVAMKAKELEATWVILDRCLKSEGEWCMKNLKCNVVVMDNAIPKVLRAENFTSLTARDVSDVSKSDIDNRTAKAQGRLSVSSDTDDIFSPLSTVHQTSSSFLKTRSTDSPLNLNSQNFDKFSPYPYATPEVQKLDAFEPSRKSFGGQTRAPKRAVVPGRRSIDSIGWSRNSGIMAALNQGTDSIRNAMSIPLRHQPSRCSICKHKMPCRVNGPRKFSYKEIEKATDRFSLENFLAEGAHGSVYRGVLPDGQVIAVKQHKTWIAKGVSEFCSEVQVLGSAQHKNLVTLLGYCIEKTWLLVYEFACNDSLDQHLYGGRDTKEVMNWQQRMKVATGAARGLRYLQEDCRVGSIVHGDFRPNSILLTHDFEAMVGDFGLARWRVDDECAEKPQLVGAFGYLAPEYMRTGPVTEKADVFSFGVILLELISGSKATHLPRNIGKEGLPSDKTMSIDELIDPRLEKNYVKDEAERMIYAANLCILLPEEQRPGMSKIVMILEGAMPEDNPVDLPSNYPIQYMNDMFGSDTPSTRSVDCVPPQHSLKHSSAYMDDASDGASKQSETDSIQDYEAYLRGSLVKFIHETR